MKHDKFPDLFPDDYEIGQEMVARTHLELGQKQMSATFMDAFTVGYVPPLWREQARRQFAEGRAEYERAKEVLEAIG